MFDHIHRAQPAGAGREQLNHTGCEIEGIDVFLECFFNAGTENLYCNFFAGAFEACLVDLSDGSSGHGRAEFRENLVDRVAEFFLYFGLCDLDRKCRKLILQHTQLLCHLVPYHIGAGREDLAEFDIGRTQCGQRAGGRLQSGITLVA